MCLGMIPVYAHDVGIFGGVWETLFMVTLLLGDKGAEVLSNLCMGGAREDADIDVINEIHGDAAIVRW